MTIHAFIHPAFRGSSPRQQQTRFLPRAPPSFLLTLQPLQADWVYARTGNTKE